MTNFLLTKPEVLFGKDNKGGKIGVKSPKENGFQFSKIRGDELPYDPIDDQRRDCTLYL